MNLYVFDYSKINKEDIPLWKDDIGKLNPVWNGDYESTIPKKGDILRYTLDTRVYDDSVPTERYWIVDVDNFTPGDNLLNTCIPWSNVGLEDCDALKIDLNTPGQLRRCLFGETMQIESFPRDFNYSMTTRDYNSGDFLIFKKDNVFKGFFKLDRDVPTGTVCIYASLKLNFYINTTGEVSGLQSWFSLKNLKKDGETESAVGLATTIVPKSFANIIDLPWRFNLKGIINDYTSNIWIDKLNEPGTMQIDIIATKEKLDLLKRKRYIACEDSEKFMIIEGIKTSYKSSSGVYKATITGRSLESILDRRIAFPSEDLRSESYTFAKSGLYAGLRKLAYDYFILPDSSGFLNSDGDPYLFPKRRIPFLTWATLTTTDSESTDRVFGCTIRRLCEDDTILDIYQELCQGYDVGFKIIPYNVLGGPTVKWKIVIYNGKDRSKSLVLSELLNNVVSMSYTEDDADEKNFIFCKKEKDVTNTYIDLSRYASQDDSNGVTSILSGFTDSLGSEAINGILGGVSDFINGAINETKTEAGKMISMQLFLAMINECGPIRSIENGCTKSISMDTLYDSSTQKTYLNPAFNISNGKNMCEKYRNASRKRNTSTIIGDTIFRLLDEKGYIGHKTNSGFIKRYNGGSNGVTLYDKGTVISSYTSANYVDTTTTAYGVNTTNFLVSFEYKDLNNKKAICCLSDFNDGEFYSQTSPSDKYIFKYYVPNPDRYNITYDDRYENDPTHWNIQIGEWTGSSGNRIFTPSTGDDYIGKRPTDFVLVSNFDAFVDNDTHPYAITEESDIYASYYKPTKDSSWRRFFFCTSDGFLNKTQLNKAVEYYQSQTGEIEGLIYSALKGLVNETSSQSQSKILYGSYDSGYSGLDRKEVMVSKESESNDFSTSDQAQWRGNNTTVNEKSTDEEETDESIINKLNKSALHQASEKVVKKDIKADINEYDVKYGKDYKLGDIVKMIDSFGHVQNAIVNEVTHTDDTNGYTVLPSFEKHEDIPTYFERLKWINIGGMITNIPGNYIVNCLETKTTTGQEITNMDGTTTFYPDYEYVYNIYLTEVDIKGDLPMFYDNNYSGEFTASSANTKYWLWSMPADEVGYWVTSATTPPVASGTMFTCRNNGTWYECTDITRGYATGYYKSSYGEENARVSTPLNYGSRPKNVGFIYGKPQSNNVIYGLKYNSSYIPGHGYSFNPGINTSAYTDFPDSRTGGDSRTYSKAHFFGKPMDFNDYSKPQNFPVYSMGSIPYICLGAKYIAEYGSENSSSLHPNLRVDANSIFTARTGDAETGTEYGGVVIEKVDAWQYKATLKIIKRAKKIDYVYVVMENDVPVQRTGWYGQYITDVQELTIDENSKKKINELIPVKIAEDNSDYENQYKFGFYDLIQKEFTCVANKGVTRAVYFNNGGKYVDS